jgi:hypothetical protein
MKFLGTHFCWGLSGPKGYWMRTEGIGHLKISKNPTGNLTRNHPTGNRTRNLPSGASPNCATARPPHILSILMFPSLVPLLNFSDSFEKIYLLSHACYISYPSDPPFTYSLMWPYIISVFCLIWILWIISEMERYQDLRSALLWDITQRRMVIMYLFFFDFLTLEDGTDTLSRNVGTGLPFDAA